LAVLFVVVFVAIVWALLHPRRTRRVTDGAHAILAERFARDEIDAEEYSARRRHLSI
jgi:uncharacterized membrane protein